MQDFKDQQVINGTWGEAWIDSTYAAEVIALEAKVALEKIEVNKTRRLGKGYKIVGHEGKGTIKLHKVSSMMILLLSDDMKKGKQSVFTIISKLDDPDAFGCERIKLTNCTFDELTLVNWEAKKNGEESIPFTFSGWEPLDLIQA